MGDERRPKSTDVLREQEPESGLAALEQYGWGEKDPVTGFYEGYNLPKELAGKAGPSVSWAQIAEQWSLVEYCFHQILGVDLEPIWPSVTWRWFSARIRMFLATDTPLAHYFSDDEPEVPNG